jgi:uncharacterized protein
MIAINVAQLLKSPPGTTRTIEFSEPTVDVAPDVELLRPIDGQARLLRTSRGILVSSSYHTTVRMECGRCLGVASVDVEGSSTDEFTPTVDVVTGHPSSELPESAELGIDEHHLLDLTEVLRQDLLTRLPLQALCRPDCPGLCPECGRELGRHGCSCERPREGASPFARLADLLRAEKRHVAHRNEEEN